MVDGPDAGIRLGEQVDRDMVSVPISPEVPTALAGALAQGVSREEVVEVLIQLNAYRGFSSVPNAFAVAIERPLLGDGTCPCRGNMAWSQSSLDHVSRP